MTTCSEVKRDLARLAAFSAAELPDGVRDHVAMCPGCGRRLAAARLARGLVAATGETLSPPDGFADRVRMALAARGHVRRPDADVWWPAWGLVPTFAAAVAALCIVYQSSDVAGPAGFFSTEGLSAGEDLVLEVSAPDVDAVLAALLEGVRR